MAYVFYMNPMKWTTVILLLIKTRATAGTLLPFIQPRDAVRDVPVHNLLPEYDFIVVGSGPGGATIASRLSENKKWNILLLEAGSHETFITDIPIVADFLKQTNYNWGYLTQPQPGTACLGNKNGQCSWPRGKALGGTSVINYMLYTRSDAREYEQWERLGNEGWGWIDVLPYFLKSENAHGTLAESPFHSTGGPLDVETPYTFPITNAFFEAGLEVGLQLNDLNTGFLKGFSLPQSTTRNGARCSASKAFLRPAQNRTNLHISMNSHVTKVLIDPDTKTILGVKFYKGGKYWIVRADREVILSAGSINTPQLLMLSGVGPRKHLESMGIKLIHDLPGVGQNLQDHVGTSLFTYVANDTVTAVGNRLVKDFGSAFDYFNNGRGKFTSTSFDGVGYIRTSLATGPLDYPDIEIALFSSSLASDSGIVSRRNERIKDDIYKTVYAPLHGKNTFSIWPLLCRPRSRGWINLKTKNPRDYPLIYANYYTDYHDILTMVEAIKFILSLGKTRAFQKYNSTLHDIPIPDCAGFTFASDDYWACTLRVITRPAHHACCTAKMGPINDPMAVVDSELRVYGLYGLRVVDASVMPVIPAAHPMAVTYMIGEKAADFIKFEYMLQSNVALPVHEMKVCY